MFKHRLVVLGLALAVGLVRLVVQQRLELLGVGQPDLGEPSCLLVLSWLLFVASSPRPK
jgi:hypothetical protein